MAQHTVENFGGFVKEVTNVSDVAYMYLLYVTYNLTKLPYEVEKSLVEILFENKDKDTSILKRYYCFFLFSKRVQR
jgi:hypothetical protein